MSKRLAYERDDAAYCEELEEEWQEAAKGLCSDIANGVRWWYRVVNDCAEILAVDLDVRKNDEKVRELVVPESLGKFGFKVSAIVYDFEYLRKEEYDYHCFALCPIEAIESVVIPRTIEHVDFRVFSRSGPINEIKFVNRVNPTKANCGEKVANGGGTRIVEIESVTRFLDKFIKSFDSDRKDDERFVGRLMEALVDALPKFSAVRSRMKVVEISYDDAIRRTKEELEESRARIAETASKLAEVTEKLGIKTEFAKQLKEDLDSKDPDALVSRIGEAVKKADPKRDAEAVAFLEKQREALAHHSDLVKTLGDLEARRANINGGDTKIGNVKDPGKGGSRAREQVARAMKRAALKQQKEAKKESKDKGTGSSADASRLDLATDVNKERMVDL